MIFLFVHFLHLFFVCFYQCMCTCICVLSSTHSIPSIVSSPKSIFNFCQQAFFNSSSTSQLSYRSNLQHRHVPSQRNADNSTCWYMFAVLYYFVHLVFYCGKVSHTKNEQYPYIFLALCVHKFLVRNLMGFLAELFPCKHNKTVAQNVLSEVRSDFQYPTLEPPLKTPYGTALACSISNTFCTLFC